MGVKIIVSEGGDYLKVYRNGLLYTEGHSLSIGDFAELLNACGSEARIVEVSEEVINKLGATILDD